MNKKDLLELEQLVKLTPKEIEKQNPDLHKKLNEKINASIKNSIADRLKVSAKNKSISDVIDKLDFSPDKIGRKDIKNFVAESIDRSDLSKGEKTKAKTILKKFDNAT